MRTEPHLDRVDIPANLRINDQIRRFRDDCRQHGCDKPYHHFAFGQSPFGPPVEVVESLRRHAEKHDYLPTPGLPVLREAVSHYYRCHFRLNSEPDRVVVSPGSKELIAILLAVLEGPVLVPTPSWVSYMPQARILRKEVIAIRTRAQDGFKLTPESLANASSGAASGQCVLILNHPHNPTGLVYTRSELEELAEQCRQRGIVVIADEIYALTSFDREGFTSMGEVFPEGTIVTGGLSKDRSSGGYRLGVGIFPEGEAHLLQNALKIAGSTNSCVAAPIQYAAVKAYSLDDDVESHVRSCAAVNAVVGETAASLFQEARCEVSVPRGAFYLFLDWNAACEEFGRIELETSADVAEDVLRVEHAAMLPGDAMLLDESEIAFRCSFVDYDGDAALADWHKRRPSTAADRRAFVHRNCPLIVEGITNLGRYIEQVREHKRPQHS